MIHSVIEKATKLGNKELADFQLGFFKTHKGGYGEGDRFLGLKVPVCRKIALEYKLLSLKETEQLLHNPYHELRLIALFILIGHFQKGTEEKKEECIRIYLNNLAYVNNWDLVDTSAYKLLGAYLLQRQDKIDILTNLANSKNLWKERVAIVSTLAFIRRGRLHETFALSEHFLHHQHDLMHKACGWMMREAGKKDKTQLLQFLHVHARVMPRTMLRYALEKCTMEEKAYFMAQARN